MKSTILILAMFCIANAKMMQAQEAEFLAFNEVTLTSKSNGKPSSYENIVNKQYLAKMMKYRQSDAITQLQKKAANFDITTLNVYDAEEKSVYDLVLNDNNAQLHVKYDHSGKIISSIERYKNVKVPYNNSRKIAMDYPNWSFEKSIYTIAYNHGSKTKRSFKVFLKKGKQRKIVTID